MSRRGGGWKPYGQELTLAIEGLAPGGEGVATCDGYTYRVPTTMPGDRIVARIIGREKGYRKATLLEVLSPAPARVAPACPAYGRCGGCAWQSMAYPAQCQALLNEVHRLFEEQGVDLSPTTWAPFASAQALQGYRGKIELTFGTEDEHLALGFHRKGMFNRLVDIETCHIGPPINSEIIRRVRAWALSHAHPPYHQRTHSGFLRHLVIRQNRSASTLEAAGGEWLAALVTTTPATEDWGQQALVAAFADLPGGALLHVVTDSLAGAVQVERLTVLRGENRLEAQLGDVRYQLGLQSFFQSNQDMAAVLLQAIQEAAALQGHERVIDLYCGVGTIALALASRASHVVGVESVPEAIQDAHHNARLNGIANVTFHVAAAERFDWNPADYQLAVLDPPRSGLHPRMVDHLLAHPSCRVLYVSCNPRALAADLARLQAAYRVERVQCFDLFPHTPHVETLVALTPRTQEALP